MSSKLPTNALKYCPDYVEFDKKARQDSKLRFRDHVMERRELLVQCIEAPVQELTNKALSLQFDHHPEYLDDDKIINKAMNTMNQAINTWDGVQFSKQFVTEFNKSGKPMDAKKFETIAKNHQDQTSWKISGNKFFAPYIAHARQYIYDYCQRIVNVDEDQRAELYNLACISYGVCLLQQKIRFHRTKPKPLIRHKTLVRSEGIHIELEHLYSELKVKKFIVAAKKARKQKDGKGTIIAKDFHNRLLECCKTLYRQQKRRVYQIFNVEINNNNHNNHQNDDDLKQEECVDVYPQDLINLDGENKNMNRQNEDNLNEPYQSSLPSLHSSSQTTHSHSRYRRSSPREFQTVNPRDYSVRHDINRNRMRQRRRARNQYREARINGNTGRQNNSNFDFNNQHNSNILTNDTLLFDDIVNSQQVEPLNAMNHNHVDGANQVEDCHCDRMEYPLQPTTSTSNDGTTNSQSSSSAEARLCQQLQRENDALRREREELLTQLQIIQNNNSNHNGLLFDPYGAYIGYQPYQPRLQSVTPQFVIPVNNDSYFNTLPPQLQSVQPPMLISGSSLNGLYGNNRNQSHSVNADNLSSFNITPAVPTTVPFIDNSNDSIAVNDFVDIDMPSLPN